MNQDKTSIDASQLEAFLESTASPPDLAEFTTTVVHDLEASLKSIAMFSELLAEQYQNKLDRQGREYIERITDGSTRIQDLVEDLTRYSRAGNGQQTWLKVDLNRVVEQAESELQLAIAEPEFTTTIGDLPQILVNPQDMHQLFQNLLENAIKFGGNSPEINISATVREEDWLFAIADNGIGIEPQFQTQIFEVFQRLHPSALYSGNGIGLAICQKIVRRYNGKIWVESKLGKGSTFYFTLPMDTCPQIASAKIV